MPNFAALTFALCLFGSIDLWAAVEVSYEDIEFDALHSYDYFQFSASILDFDSSETSGLGNNYVLIGGLEEDAEDLLRGSPFSYHYYSHPIEEPSAQPSAEPTALPTHIPSTG